MQGPYRHTSLTKVRHRRSGDDARVTIVANHLYASAPRPLRPNGIATALWLERVPCQVVGSILQRKLNDELGACFSALSRYGPAVSAHDLIHDV